MTEEQRQVEAVAAIIAEREAHGLRLTVRHLQRDLRAAFGPKAVPCHIPIRRREEDA